MSGIAALDMLAAHGESEIRHWPSMALLGHDDGLNA